MRISNENGYVTPQLDIELGNNQKPQWVTGSSTESGRKDSLELSPSMARQLPDGEIKDGTARLFFNADINGSLESILTGKEPEVSEAAYRIIEKNLFSSDAGLSDEDRAVLREAGLNQAKFLADRFMDKNEATRFLDTIKLLAAVSATREVDSITGNASYVQLPQKPAGAPDDYLNVNDLMKKYDPESYAKMQAAGGSGKNFASLAIHFAQKLRQNPKWVNEYRDEQEKLMKNLKNTAIPNRFGSIEATNAAEYERAMNDRIQQVSGVNQDLLAKNNAAFAKLLSSVQPR